MKMMLDMMTTQVLRTRLLAVVVIAATACAGEPADEVGTDTEELTEDRDPVGEDESDGEDESPMGEAETSRQSNPATCASIDVFQSDFNIWDTAAAGGSRDGIVSLGDLEAIVRRSGHGLGQSAAKYFLRHPDLWRKLDVAAKRDSPDDKVSFEDLRTYKRHHCGDH